MPTQPGKLLIGSLAGLALGGLAMWLAVGFGAGGHGTYLPAAVLFPYSMIMAVGLARIPPLLIALAAVQFPAYGLAAFHRRIRMGIAVAHLVGAGLACLLVSGSETFR